MIVFKLALRNLGRNRRTSLALLSLVIAGAFVFLLGDSVLNAAAKGITSEFRDGYTGDIVVKAISDRQFGIFGYSIPVIGDYETVPNLSEASDIRRVLAEEPGIESCAGLVSGAALLQGPGGCQIKVPVFGVDATEYFALFPTLSFAQGSIPRDGEAWIILPRSRLEEIERADGRKISVGDTFQFTMATNSAFTIRAVTLKGIVETPFRTFAETVPVYTDVTTLRSLLGLSLGNEEALSEVTGSENRGQSLDIDDFFGLGDNATGGAGDRGGPTGIELLKSYLGEGRDEGQDQHIDPQKGSWQFLLVRLSPGTGTHQTIASLNKELRKEKISAEASGWLGAAGLNAGILFLIKTVFEIGIGILAGIVVLVLTNGLAFSVMEQEREIATMRSMGAQRGFVAALYFLESLYLVLLGALVGLGLAELALAAAAGKGVPITNSYLQMLFGTSLLRPELNTKSVNWMALSAFGVALASSLYPIVLASRTSLAQSMTTE